MNSSIKRLPPVITLKFKATILKPKQRNLNQKQNFAETFAEGMFAFEQGIMIHYLLSQNDKFTKDAIKSVEGIPSALDKTLEAVLFMRTSFAKIPFLNNNLKDIQNTMLIVIDSILNDY
ncbi:hypothetical protein V8G69_10570 [Gaetbulibacter sp. M235]|uniref:hypothetical protein n=1 Tax=Gaetbulibacter sp. M235 TaxID=3126510 RepID=UPI00374F1346